MIRLEYVKRYRGLAFTANGVPVVMGKGNPLVYFCRNMARVAAAELGYRIDSNNMLVGEFSTLG